MNLWSSIFGKKNTMEMSNNSQMNTVAEQLPGNNINVMEDLFIDNTPPILDTAVQSQHISISSFLERDFHRKGYEDGYSWHSAEMLDNQIKAIKSEFRYFLDQKVDELRQEILKLSDQKINVSGLSERMTQQLQLRIDLLDVNVQRLDREKEFSSQDEGLVMKCINQYRDGFIRGMETYQEEKLFAGSTGLFI
jgi:hypothetical protein